MEALDECQSVTKEYSGEEKTNFCRDVEERHPSRQ